MKKENTLTLIGKNEDQASSQIEVLKLRAKETTVLIQEFNSINLLNPIVTQEQALKFLQDPVAYFDNRILEDLDSTGIPLKVAEYRGIPYNDIVKKIGVCQLEDLKYMVFNEADQVIEFDESCTEKIMKSHYEYATDKLESDAIVETCKLCKLLNSHCIRWGVDMSDMSKAAQALGLKVEYLSGTTQHDRHTGEFVPHIPYLRHRLEYEKVHSDDKLEREKDMSEIE